MVASKIYRLSHTILPMPTKMTALILAAFAILSALTGSVMAVECSPNLGLATFDPNLGSVSDSVNSRFLVQCDGVLFTKYSYQNGLSNGEMQAPIITNQTMFQTGYEENTFAHGLTSYSNNVSTNMPTVAGQINSLSTDRNILFETVNGAIVTEESVYTNVFGNFPMNGSKESRIEGGSLGSNHLAGMQSQFFADNIALSSQNSVIGGTIDRPSPFLGADADLVNLDSSIIARGHSFGFSNVHSFAFDQTALPNSTTVGAQHSYAETVTVNGNFVLDHEFNWALRSVPTIQTFAPENICMFG
jgi:hypothetical protein